MVERTRGGMPARTRTYTDNEDHRRASRELRIEALTRYTGPPGAFSKIEMRWAVFMAKEIVKWRAAFFRLDDVVRDATGGSYAEYALPDDDE